MLIIYILKAEFAYEDDLRAMLKTFGDPLPRIEVDWQFYSTIYFLLIP